jgi:hypothetical protein
MMAPPVMWSVQVLGRARRRLLRGRGRVRAPGRARRRPSSEAEAVSKPWGRARRSSSSSVEVMSEPWGRARRSPSSSESWLSPSSGVGRGEVHLSRPRRGPSPGVGRGGASYGARGWTWLLSASLCRVAQQSERRRWRCSLVRSVSGAAK